MKNFVTSVGAIVVSLFIIAIAALIGGIVIMWLWNWLMPVIFGLTTITYLQGAGLAALCGLLFKNNSTNTKEKD